MTDLPRIAQPQLTTHNITQRFFERFVNILSAAKGLNPLSSEMLYNRKRKSIKERHILKREPPVSNFPLKGASFFHVYKNYDRV